VKSCISTRAGRKAISRSDDFFFSHVLVAQQVLQKHLQRIGKFGDAFQAVLLGRLEAEIFVGLVADLEGLAGLEAVEGGGGHCVRPLAFGGLGRNWPSLAVLEINRVASPAPARLAAYIENF
jgi:hypothetical protein